MKKKISLFIALIFFCATSENAFAQPRTGFKQVFSLDDCIEAAKNNNYDARLTDYQIKSANAGVTSAFGDFLPSIDFQAGYQRQLSNVNHYIDIEKGDIVSTENSYNMRANASLLLFDGFAREARYSGALDERESTLIGARHTISRVVKDVTLQYIEVVRTAQTVAALRENLELSRKELERIQAQYDAGTITVNNVYSQEATIGSKEIELINAENNHKIAKANLLSIMGLEPDMDAEFLESSAPNSVTSEQVESFRSTVGSFGAAVNAALDNREDYKAARLRAESYQSAKKAASSGYFPRISAYGGWNFNNYEFSEFNKKGTSYIGLNFSIPVFENFNTNANMETAQLQYKQAEFERDRLAQTIRMEVKTKFLNLEAAEKQIDVAARLLRSAKLNYEAADARFKAGAGTLFELQQANSQLINAQIENLTTVYLYVKAQKDLLYSIGKLQ